jgi:guanine nucleotide-binding protein subunit alpha
LEDIFDDDATDDTNSVTGSKSKGNGIGDQPSPSTSLMNGSIVQSSPGSIAQSEATGHSGLLKETGPTPIGLLRLRLSHLVSMDSALADRLSGGITVSGSGKGGVYVRSGWQARTIENALGMAKSKQQSSSKQIQSAQDSHDVPYDPLVTDVARMLKSSEDDIRELWNHPVVKDLIAKRRLKLDEWSEL